MAGPCFCAGVLSLLVQVPHTEKDLGKITGLTFALTNVLIIQLSLWPHVLKSGYVTVKMNWNLTMQMQL